MTDQDAEEETVLNAWRRVYQERVEERDEARTRLVEVEATCAVMREALSGLEAWDFVSAALTPNAGKSLLAELAALREAWDSYAFHQSPCAVNRNVRAVCGCGYNALAARLDALKIGSA